MKKTLLADINVWLALVFDAHVHHPSALDWFNAITDEIAAFCRLTQQGFLRLANNPNVFGADAVSADEAWKLYDKTLSDYRVAYCEEPAGLETVWRKLTTGRSFSPKLWNDAYLAAFAETAAFEVVTFDRGFTQYKDVTCTVLS
jgi:toxin-antitoxin system PIN domain toxin